MCFDLCLIYLRYISFPKGIACLNVIPFAGACLITVNTAAGVNRHGIASAALAMEPATPEQRATRVSMRAPLQLRIAWCLLCAGTFLTPHLNITMLYPLCSCLILPASVFLWVIKPSLLPRPQSPTERTMNFWSVQRPGLFLPLCVFRSGLRRGTTAKSIGTQKEHSEKVKAKKGFLKA